MEKYNIKYQVNIPQELIPVYWSEETRKRIEAKTNPDSIKREMGTQRVFRERFPDSESVLNAIFKARLAKTEGKCPKCNCDVSLYKKVHGKMIWKCRCCHHRVAPLKGTPLQGTHIKLISIFEIIYQMLNTKHGLTAAETSRYYGYKPMTALNILHRIRVWVGKCNEDYPFWPNEDIENDEVHLKTVHPGSKKQKGKRKRGVGSERLTHVLTMVGRKSGIAKAVRVTELNQDNVRDMYIRFDIQTTNSIKTDESKLYDFLTELGFDRASCNHMAKQWIGPNNAHTNTLEGLHHLMKGAYDNVHRCISRKHTEKYLSETLFKFSTRHKTIPECFDDLLKSLPKLF